MNSYKYIAPWLMALGIFSCRFEEVNTNPYEVKPEMGKGDGASIGASFTSLASRVMTVGTVADGTKIANKYQTAYHLSADVWSGYFGQNNTWGGGYTNPNYFLVEGWCASSYQASYTDIVEPWRSIKIESEKAQFPEAFALAEILKILSWHKTTDMFGPIPYSKIDQALIATPYDSQEQVYQQFFNELTQAIELLSPKAQQGLKILRDYDIIYAGDLNKWIKLANSLMLRLAMRIRYADPVKAQRYAEQAAKHELGLITSKAEEAKIAEGAGLSFMNNLDIFTDQYAEARMGASIYSYLVGYQDPRLTAYFKPSTSATASIVGFTGQKFQAITPGHNFGQTEEMKAYSALNIKKNTPIYIMRASEVAFLLAEGALLGWDMAGQLGDAASQAFYKRGISLSFEENNLSPSLVTNYLASGLHPAEFRDVRYRVTMAAPTQATTAWSGTEEEKLEKIITQKWLALYPNGQEAWSEWRRTGYPRLHPIHTNNSGGEIPTASGVRRLKYPSSKLSVEARKQLDEALKLLGGPNTGATKLWWDKKASN